MVKPPDGNFAAAGREIGVAEHFVVPEDAEGARCLVQRRCAVDAVQADALLRNLYEVTGIREATSAVRGDGDWIVAIRLSEYCIGRAGVQRRSALLQPELEQIAAISMCNHYCNELRRELPGKRAQKTVKRVHNDEQQDLPQNSFEKFTQSLLFFEK